ncbi:hypothetical protein J3Q64DRAFT_1775918 [Phycomyces blakesleeanus]|uniref:Uncharacterized protein n=1 Tax=Phycomyces blakesleeanus TaxID=4837 RepID=A0ABR3AK03_PHYBL
MRVCVQYVQCVQCVQCVKRVKRVSAYASIRACEFTHHLTLMQPNARVEPSNGYSQQFVNMRQNPRARRNALHAYISYMTYTDLSRRRPKAHKQQAVEMASSYPSGFQPTFGYNAPAQDPQNRQSWHAYSQQSNGPKQTVVHAAEKPMRSAMWQPHHQHSQSMPSYQPLPYDQPNYNGMDIDRRSSSSIPNRPVEDNGRPYSQDYHNPRFESRSPVAPVRHSPMTPTPGPPPPPQPQPQPQLQLQLQSQQQQQQQQLKNERVNNIPQIYQRIPSGTSTPPPPPPPLLPPSASSSLSSSVAATPLQPPPQPPLLPASGSAAPLLLQPQHQHQHQHQQTHLHHHQQTPPPLQPQQQPQPLQLSMSQHQSPISPHYHHQQSLPNNVVHHPLTAFLREGPENPGDHHNPRPSLPPCHSKSTMSPGSGLSTNPSIFHGSSSSPLRSLRNGE